ncbi:D-alanyl-D-alanine carboxypeptidase [Streptomyces sp. HB132]|uniref:D-alanyl-D-alanine carboxypeptidase n=1 Tax=Streptomyces sp. HB132 TaxID=767388 RepID=UPI001E117452|nr:D-alanyl-D-alanine carboxypeptidase [Streptomyces sp. HB132]MBM7441491.1 D-alanyl-D-alanine carboxypeptidase [Streptomyces sp. HB132]
MTPRLIKEVSVAGESPDMSEQRKSSGTAEERDPRLAVFRGPGAEAGADAEGGTPGAATDSETAVFRMPSVPDASEGASAPEGRAEGAEGAEGGPEGSEGASEAGGPAGEATAAPGASAGPAEPFSGGAGADSGGVKADSGAKSGSEADTGAEAEVEDDVEAGAETDAEADAEADTAAGPGSCAAVAAGAESSRSDADVEPGSEAGAAEAEEDMPASGGRSASGAEREDAPEAAPVAAPTASGAGSDARADAADADGESDTEPDAEPASGSASDEGAQPTDARLRAAVAAWVETDSDEESAAQDGAAEARDVSSDDGAGSARAATDGEAADTRDDARATGGTAAPAASDTEPADTEGPAESATEASEEIGGVPAVSASADGPRVPRTREEAAPAKEPEPARDGRGIDHPTAVFKAPRAEQLDQPTTALKLPSKGSGAPRKPASWAAEPSGTPEAPAERTSKFVPLRSDDVRPPAVVGPTVTPDIAAGPRTPASPGAGLTEAERTRQQPMPPRPPLDLLAELTNTPPPEETPVRTAVRRVKIWTPLVLLLLIAFAIAQGVRPLPEPVLELTTKQTYDFEGSKPSLPWPGEGQGYMAATGLGTVDSFGEQKAVPIGSVAKAMTAYVVLKDHPLKKGADGPAVKIDATAEKEGKLDSVGESTLNTVKAGETITQQEALSAIMIPSANNIARLLARWDAGSEEAFVKKMNDTAKELGMTKTTYTDPSGLNATTVSSAEDQVKLGEKLVEIPALMDITKLPSWTDPSGKFHRNYNTLVPYDGALGIKTGSTTKAGGNLLFAAHKKVGDTDQLIVGAILGQHKPSIIDTVNAVSKEAMIATQDLLASRTVVKKGQVVGVVDDGFGHTTDVVVAEDVKAVGWPGLTVKLELTDDGKTIPNTAPAGTRVGTMTVGEGASQVEVAVTLSGALAEPSFGDKLMRVT